MMIRRVVMSALLVTAGGGMLLSIGRRAFSASAAQPSSLPAVRPSTAPSTKPAAAPAAIPTRDGLIVGGSWSGVYVHGKVAEAFRRAYGGRVGVLGKSDERGFEYLAAGSVDVLMHSAARSADVRGLVDKSFPKGTEQPKRVDFGRYVALAVVPKSSTVLRLTRDQLRGIFAGRTTNWGKVGGEAGQVQLYGVDGGHKGHEIFAREVMRGTPLSRSLRFAGSDLAVAAAVAKDRVGIGFLVDVRLELPGVKALEIALDANGPYHGPTEEGIFEGNYPLTEDLDLYLPPHPTLDAIRYCQFATGPEGAGHAKLAHLWAEEERRTYFLQKRVKAMKAGRGIRIPMAGVASLSKLVNDLAERYTLAREIVQPVYAPAETDAAAVGLFLAGDPGGAARGAFAGRELLFLENRPRRAALAAHGEKWNDLNPAEHMIAGRATIVVVNAGSKLESLTLEQLRSVFTGEVADWKTLTTESAVLAPGRIVRYGPPDHEAAMRLFRAECLPTEKIAAVALKKDTAEVLSAVSMDPLGIGLVDLAAMPGDPAKAGVKVVPIGPAGRAVEPSAETIRKALYPVSQRLFLYVHPKAGETAKDFASFLASAACEETYRKHGLISLAARLPVGVDDPAAPPKAAPTK